MPIATGIKVANPDLKVLALGGDGTRLPLVADTSSTRRAEISIFAT
jgi:thiamine pyrophosphate-dependent acetolactate synthase large subunit-like protein